MSSILDALNKKRSDLTALPSFARGEELCSKRNRNFSLGSSPLRIALWVISTVAVCAWVGLFLFYRLAAMGWVAEKPPGMAKTAESQQHRQASPGTIATLPAVEFSPAGVEGFPEPAGGSGEVPSVSQSTVETSAGNPAEAVEPSSRNRQPPVASEDKRAEKAEPAKATWEEDSVRVPSAGAVEFSLSGIMLNDKRPVAIINGRIVGMGEQVEGHRVLAISKDGVRLEGWATLLEMDE